jgi:eukaryotic-like serine/threonine-protein kinase
MERRVLNDRYEIEGPLGRGGMAQVFRATDRVLGRQVAVKVLDRRHKDDARFVTRFQREAQSAAGINHPNVVSVYDTGSEDGNHFIVMEYVDGDTLDDLLRREGPLSPGRAVALAEPVARALEAAHQKGMVHRDVKPGNIMVDHSGTVKVVDFGIARAAATDTLTQTGTVLGTAAYFSPEQAQGETVDARSDVYSLGCVLYEMLTGQQPFKAESPLAVAFKHVREDPVPPARLNSSVPPELDAVVMTAMAKDPAARYPSGGAMREALSATATGEMPAAVGVAPTQQVAAGDTSVMTRPATTPATVPPGERRGAPAWLPWAVIAVIVLALVVLAYLAFGREEPRRAGANGPGTEQPPGATTPPEEEPTDPVGIAFANLAAVLREGVSSGEVSEKAAADIGEQAEEALTAYNEGDQEGAAAQLAEAHAVVSESVTAGEITSEERGAAIRAAIDGLAQAMGVTATIPEADVGGNGEGEGGNGEGGGEGNSSSSGPPDEPPGKAKGHENGEGQGND